MTKSFLRGVGTVVDLFALRKDQIKLTLPQHSDEEAIYSDWQQVGSDIKSAAEYFNNTKSSYLKNNQDE